MRVLASASLQHGAWRRRALTKRSAHLLLFDRALEAAASHDRNGQRAYGPCALTWARQARYFVQEPTRRISGSHGDVVTTAFNRAEACISRAKAVFYYCVFVDNSTTRNLARNACIIKHEVLCICVASLSESGQVRTSDQRRSDVPTCLAVPTPWPRVH
jgi:hypothetical protein